MSFCRLKQKGLKATGVSYRGPRRAEVHAWVPHAAPPRPRVEEARPRGSRAQTGPAARSGATAALEDS